jgi:hypothetical protein
LFFFFYGSEYRLRDPSVDRYEGFFFPYIFFPCLYVGWLGGGAVDALMLCNVWLQGVMVFFFLCHRSASF